MNPEDKFCQNLQHSDKPEFQALRLQLLRDARDKAEYELKMWRFEIFKSIMLLKGDFDL